MKIYEILTSSFFTLLSGIMYLKCYSYSFHQNINRNKKNTCIFIIICVVMLINNYFNVVDFKLIISFFITSFMYVLLYKASPKDSLIFTLLLFIIATIVEVFLVLIVSRFTFISVNMNNNIYLKVLLSFVHLLLLFLLFNNKKVSSFVKQLTIYFSNIITNNIIIFSIIIIINLMYVFYGLNINNLRLLVFIIVTSICFLIFYVYATEKHKKDKYLIKTKYLSELVEKYEEIIKEYKTLKHNLINDLLTIKASNDANVIDAKIKKYSKDYEWLSTIEVIPTGIQGLIYLKSQQAQRKKVNIKIQSNGFDKSSINIKPKTINIINEVLGIYIDNAVEAVEKTSKKEVIILLNKTSHHLNIEIINELKSQININELGNLNYSTKKKKSGIGLDYAKKISFGKIRTSVNIINNYYVVRLRINITKEKNQ